MEIYRIHYLNKTYCVGGDNIMEAEENFMNSAYYHPDISKKIAIQRVDQANEEDIVV